MVFIFLVLVSCFKEILKKLKGIITLKHNAWHIEHMKIIIITKIITIFYVFFETWKKTIKIARMIKEVVPFVVSKVSNS